MQRATIDYLPIFLDMNVPDWRLDKIPQHYQELIQQENLLRSDDVTNVELKKLSQLTPRLISLCEQLSSLWYSRYFKSWRFSRQ